MLVPYFKRKKILKILQEYERVYNSKIDADSPYRKELLKLQTIELDSLACMYDMLQGYGYITKETAGTASVSVDTHIPDRSLCVPSTLKTSAPYSGLSAKIRFLKNARLAKEFYYKPELRHKKATCCAVGKTLWKNINSITQF